MAKVQVLVAFCILALSVDHITEGLPARKSLDVFNLIVNLHLFTFHARISLKFNRHIAIQDFLFFFKAFLPRKYMSKQTGNISDRLKCSPKKK
jgi:hypothetical protein